MNRETVQEWFPAGVYYHDTGLSCPHCKRELYASPHMAGHYCERHGNVSNAIQKQDAPQPDRTVAE